MHGMKPLPVPELYIPADPEDELSESPKHFRQMQIGLDGLDRVCRMWNEPFSVIQNVEVLYEDGRVCPDQAAIRGVPDLQARSYDIRKTGIPPTVVFEYSSQRSGEHDRTEKYRIYEGLGVKEYFIFHVEEIWLVGYRLAGGAFRPIKRNRAGRLKSRELGIELGVHAGFLRMYRDGVMIPAAREKDKALAEKDEALAEKDEALAEKDEALAEKDEALAERDRIIEELRRKLADLEGSGRG